MIQCVFGTNGVQGHELVSTVRMRRDDRERSRQQCIMKKGEDRRIARCLFGLNNNGVKISSEAALCG